ncbi:MAG: nucleotidyltransferase domain-containing protein [Cyanobacteria bacterium P01_H01_bin.74]
MTPSMDPSAWDHGLSDQTVSVLNAVFLDYNCIEKVLIFGSRANAIYHPGSDIDLAIVAPTMTAAAFAALYDALQTLPLIYKLDCIHWDALEDKAFQQTIVETGQVLFQS